MRSFTVVVMAMGLACSSAAAQQTRVEVGTKAGATLAWVDGGDKEVFIGLPGTGGALFLPSIYVTWFPSPAFMVEPQVLFQYSSVEDDVTLMGALQLGYRFAISRTGSFYPAVNVGWLTIANGGESATLGGGFGLRWEVCTKLGLRTELVYRRWMCDGCELNEVILSFGGGVLF